MGDLQQLLRFEVANSAVAFRKHGYGSGARHELLRDLLGLANAATTGTRYIFLGVDDTVGGARQIVGLSDTEAAEIHELYQTLIADFIDPPLIVGIEEAIVDDARVVAVVISDCDDPPYLLKKNASNAMRIGNGWIRQGAHYKRITRPDLQRIFEQKLLAQSVGAEIRVGFAGRVLETTLNLPVLRLEQLPSEAAKVRFRKMLDARQAAQEVCGQDGTRIQRLVHAQVFGHGELYRPHSEGSLRQRLNRTGEDYAAADRHYEFETRSQRLNLVLENLGGAVFDRGMLVLDFPCMEGVGIADRIWPAPDGRGPVPEGYPTVDIGPRTIRVQAALGPVVPGARLAAFRQPLRLGLREPAIGKTISVSYSLHGKSLRRTLSGTLRIHVVDDQ